MERRKTPGIYKIRDGVYKVMVTGAPDPLTGKRRQYSKRVHGGIKEAEKERGRLLLKYGGDLGDPSSITLRQLIDAWRATRTHEASTKRDLDSVVRFIPERLMDSKLSQVTARDIDSLYSARQKLQGVGPDRVRKLHNLLHASFDQAVRWEWVGRNVIDATSPPAIVLKRPKAPSTKDIRRVLDATDGWLRVFLVLDVDIGARRGEVLAVKWGDVDLDAGRVSIDKAVTDLGEGIIEVKPTKEEDWRILNISPFTVEVLKDWKTSTPTSTDDGAFIFSRSVDGRRAMRPEYPSNLLKSIRDKNGLSKVRIKDLRTYVATMLIKKQDPLTAARRLGHSKPSMTLDRYGGHDDESDKKASDILGDEMWGDQSA
jgi:integrase